jgi:xylan 1,4-beta-xylosidase
MSPRTAQTLRIIGSCAILSLLGAIGAWSAQQTVNVRVDASKALGRIEPVWAWVGHDEPNYIYSAEGLSLLTKLAQLSSSPIHDRIHNLLTSGDGAPALKWGSTNVFSCDASGKPVYSWTITDQIFDTYKALGITPFVEIGFMPEALSTHPEPYQHHWPQGPLDTGWSYPPTNYDEWSELVYRWVRHLADRYGAAEVTKWEWEVWNEPDIFYWHGTMPEYFKLYDYTVSAVRRALPTARVGGPATTGPANQHAADFLRQFLQHCADGQNYATGKKEVPLDFISFHAKGRTSLVNNHVELNMENQLRDIDQGFAIVEKFSTLRHLPLVLSESDPEGCAACDVQSHPENAYRLGSQYASYEAELLDGTLALARRHDIRLEGAITWAFTFPGQPIFAGLRSFTTQDIDLPLLNIFRMFGLLRGERIATESSGSLGLDSALQFGVRTKPDINAMAALDGQQLDVLVWNYRDDSAATEGAEIHLIVNSLPHAASQVSLKQWRIDQDHSNPYAAWQAMGSPQSPSAAQYELLRAAGELQEATTSRAISVKGNSAEFTFTEPSQGVSLLRLTW